MIHQEDQLVLVAWASSKKFVKRMWLFGSRARGDHHENSDLDVAIDIDRVLPMDGSPRVSFQFGHESWEKYLQHRMIGRLHLCFYDPNIPNHRVFRHTDEIGNQKEERIVSIVQSVAECGILIYQS